MSLRERVFSNLNDAMDGGYDISAWSADDIVADLVAFAADCEDEAPADLLPHVEAWLLDRRGNLTT